MSRREHAEHSSLGRNTHRRCGLCRLHLPLCLCELVQPSDTVTRVVLVLNADEADKPTNTGQLAVRSLQNARVSVVNDTGRTTPLRVDDAPPLLLFPASDAVVLSVELAAAGPFTLVVPDGTWRQARKMRTRVPGLRDIPCVTLPAHAPTAYQLRAELRGGGLSTLEAIAYALDVLEAQRDGGAVKAQLLHIQRVFVGRTQWMRGQRADAEVFGGVPVGARRG